MHPDFWHKKWETNEIGFHLADANPLLIKHFSALGLAPGQRVFVPLCGKTLDIAWLLDKGLSVVGAELSVVAIEQLFAELGVAPEITEFEELLLYQAPGLDIFVGDIFYLSPELLGKVDAVYDRAALVALPADMRGRYTDHVMQITQCVPQLLICFDYDQAHMPGPPFCVNAAEVQAHYKSHYQLTLLDDVAVAGGLKGICAAQELVFLLRPL